MKAYHFKYRSNVYKRINIFTVISKSMNTATTHFLNWFEKHDSLLSLAYIYTTEVSDIYLWRITRENNLYGFVLSSDFETLWKILEYNDSITDVEVTNIV